MAGLEEMAGEKLQFETTHPTASGHAQICCQAALMFGHGSPARELISKRNSNFVSGQFLRLSRKSHASLTGN